MVNKNRGDIFRSVDADDPPGRLPDAKDQSHACVKNPPNMGNRMPGWEVIGEAGRERVAYKRKK